MRNLIACPGCARQYDASERAPGSRFHCLCGRVVTVREPHAHDAAVVRCSGCGAPRLGGAAACGYCGADFTLHERDLHTICPACAARVSDRARYCHHCATALLPQPLGAGTEHPCPACGDGAGLDSRRLGDEQLAVLECPRCAGLWVGRDTFEVLLDRARARSVADPSGRPPPPPSPSHRQHGPLYRPCPECGGLMNRRNFGRRSGVIVDTCAAHGSWFDDRELTELLRWVREGGEAEVARRRREELQALDREQRLKRWDTAAGRAGLETGDETLVDVLAGLSGWILP